MNYKHLCMLFRITHSVCSRIINKMLRKVVRKLQNHPFAQVRFPDEHKMREYADMVQLQEPEVDNIIGFMDGVSFCLNAQTSGLSRTLFIVDTIATQWLIRFCIWSRW
jgi:hypothetical protein